MIRFSRKFRNGFAWAIRVAVTLLAAFVLYRQLSTNHNFAQFLAFTRRLTTAAVTPVFSAITLLMVLNCLSEAYKWRSMVAVIHRISYAEAVQAVLCGISLGTVTPGRIGDFGARVALLPPRKRIQGAVALGAGTYAQFMMINMAASIALPVFIYLYLPEHRYLVFIMLFTTPLYFALLLFLYLNIGAVSRLIGRISFLARYRYFFAHLAIYERRTLFEVLGICFFKLCILIVQYFLLLNLFIPSVTFGQVTVMIVLLVAVQTIVPTIELFNIGLKGAAAAYLFGVVTRDIPAVLAAVAAIWFINLIVPSVIGLFILVKARYRRLPDAGTEGDARA